LSENETDWTKNFELTTDITFIDSDFQNAGDFYNNGLGFTPIGNNTNTFTGAFNGKGYIIDGLYINNPSADYMGFFGCMLGATIDSLGVINVEISGNAHIGSLAGQVKSSTVNNCYTTGSVSASGNSVGGFVGSAMGPSGEPEFTKCYTTCNVNATGSSNNNAGGFVGYQIANFTNCYARGNVSATNYNRVSAFVGYSSRGQITNCYATGKVTSNGANVGGLIGALPTTINTTVTSSYWNKTTTEQASDTHSSSVGFITSKFADESNFIDWDFDNTWRIGIVSDVAAQSYPYFQEQIPLGLATFNVSNEDGDPVASADIYVDGIFHATTNENGAVEFEAKEGNSSYNVIADGYIEEMGDFTLSENTTVNVILEKGTTVTFKVTDNNVDNVPDITINIEGGYIPLVTNDNGEVSITLLAGTYEYSIVHANYVEKYGTLTVGNINFAYSVILQKLTQAADSYAAGDGTSSNPWQIENLAQLRRLSETGADWDNHFILTADIDASETKYWNRNDYDTCEGFSPIGTGTLAYFNGKFNGKEHIISGLYIYRPNTYYVGLFGYTNGTQIDSVGLVDVDITGYFFAGALVGSFGWYFYMNNCYATGNVSGYTYVGGLIGGCSTDSKTTTISNSYADVDVSGTASVGGFSGYFGFPNNTLEKTISNCHATGNASASSANIGGFTGKINDCTLNYCYATGDASGYNSVGGLVGYINESVINNSYSTGSLTSSYSCGGFSGTVTSSEINNSYTSSDVDVYYYYGGGFIGASDETKVNNSYATGSVYAYAFGAGFVGYCDGFDVYNTYATGKVSGSYYIDGFTADTLDNVTSSYYDIQTSGDLSTSSTVESLTTVEFINQSTFNGWEFGADTTWITGFAPDGFLRPIHSWCKTNDLTIITDENGGVLLTPNKDSTIVLEEGTYPCVNNAEVTLTANPNDDWYFYKWVINGNVNYTKTITITIDTATIVELYMKSTTSSYSLTIAADGKGTVSPAEGTYIYETGNKITLSATPDEGWAFDKWVIDEIELTDNPLELVMDYYDIEATAYFAQVPDTLYTKLQLLEEFTSSSCPPCATYNAQLHEILFDDDYIGKYSLIRYQMNWPYLGDYYNEDGGIRRAYYDVDAIPYVVRNGNIEEGNNGFTVTQDKFESLLDEETYLAIDAMGYYNGNTITINAKISSRIDKSSDLVAQIAVFEYTTEENVSINGETEFYNVMMKMLPDASGTSLNDMTKESPFGLNESYDMSTSFVEEMDDLGVVIFVQNTSTKEVEQSIMVPIYSIDNMHSISVVVTDENNNAVPGAVVEISASIDTTNNDGIAKFNLFDGTYSYKVTYSSFDDMKGSFTVDGDDLEIKLSLISGLSSIQSINIEVNPNPVKDYFTIRAEKEMVDNFTIHNTLGKIIQFSPITDDETKINLSAYQSGIYFITVTSNNGLRKTIKIVKE
jgi:hypothetical protein